MTLLLDWTHQRRLSPQVLGHSKQKISAEQTILAKFETFLKGGTFQPPAPGKKGGMKRISDYFRIRSGTSCPCSRPLGAQLPSAAEKTQGPSTSFHALGRSVG